MNTLTRQGWSPSNWREEWRREGSGFLVSVKHHTEPIDKEFGTSKGGHRWAVYAYVYPSHPRFATLRESMEIFDPVLGDWPLHGGCSRIHVYRLNGTEISGYEIGADYGHLGDDRFTFCDTPDMATRVFFDADLLFEFLSAPIPGEAADES
jgi:hypothetical protein